MLKFNLAKVIEFLALFLILSNLANAAGTKVLFKNFFISLPLFMHDLFFEGYEVYQRWL